MAENEINSNLILEPQKTRKISTIILTIIVIGIGVGAGLGTYYGLTTIHHHSVVTPITLDNLNNSPLNGKESMTQDEAFSAFITNNSTATNLKESINITSFKAPDYSANGSLTIKAKTNSKYTGTITTIITAIKTIDIRSLEFDIATPIEYTSNMSTDDAFNKFESNNSGKVPTDLKTNIDLAIKVPTYTNPGLLTIKAIKNSKYTGSIEITISQLTKIELSNLNLNTTLSEAYTNQTDAFNAFISLNSQISDLKDNVKVGSFTPIGTNDSGSLVIWATGNGKYIGIITINIVVMERINLNDLNLSPTIQGTPEMMEDYSGVTTVETYLSANNYSNLTNNIDFKINWVELPSFDAEGTISISGINKYIGDIYFTITKVVITDQDIVDTVKKLNIVFDAYKGYNQSLDNFISVVLHGEGNLNNPTNDPLWYIRGQLEKHINESWILNYADLTKYQFIQFCIKDDNHTPLTDTYLNSHYQVGDTATVQVNFNYGDATNQYIDFNLQLRDY